MSGTSRWNIVTQTPLGEQRGTFTFVPDGNRFTGRVENPMGTMDVTDGAIDGNRLTWTMAMTMPMPMTLEGEATIDGDSLAGTVKTAMFGAMKLAGTRIG